MIERGQITRLLFDGISPKESAVPLRITGSSSGGTNPKEYELRSVGIFGFGGVTGVSILVFKIRAIV